MARNKTLLSMLQDLRAEIRASGNAAHNTSTRESHVYLLQRTQEILWEDYAWRHLQVERFIDPQAGQRYYAPPEDMPIDRIQTIDVRYGEQWIPLGNDITNEQYSIYDSYLDERSYPVQQWRIDENDQIEIWPIPDSGVDPGSLEGRLRLTGTRALRPLVKDTDRADLDDRMIVLYAAAELLAAQGAKDAPLKLGQAERRKAALVANPSKIKQFKLFGGESVDPWRSKGPRMVHYRDRETGN